MSLNESIVEDAALMWFGELGDAVGCEPNLSPGEPATLRDKLLPKLPARELGAAGMEKEVLT